jgi:hypothetical protein
VKPIRVLGFSVVFFLLYTVYFVYFEIRTLAMSQPNELIWYLQLPLESMIPMILKWVSRNPLLILTFLQIVIQALVLGLLTELAWNFLRRHLRFGS